MSDDRAVSEVLGFVLTFSLITMTIALVFTAGFGGLQDAQHTERVTNVERAFEVLGTNVEEVHLDGAPSRSTEMRLSGGTLAHGEPVRVTVEWGENSENSSTFETYPLVYRNGDTEIAYELGGIVRTDGDHGVMLGGPPLIVGERSTLPLLVTTTPGDRASIAGQRTVLVTSSHQRTQLHVVRSEEPVTVVIESPRADVWERYLDRSELEPNRTGDTVEFTIDCESTVDCEYTSVSVTWVRLRLR
ncbi:DUF7289 family protein [Halalkalicoccus jeotgali]|uniref:Uncharacterized protein n=1 Tax=Halalkalicoccus jeotgali (strain DSM 18796 / CECT 7217 / JCM 14584 / KCTC 4019 / B3) TaxID=795797 RepID=D8J4U6_HALJB|nr:hypothetical protein [Halalkalicoccus jeotgali]ADJ15563.1 hypothetical protein HacjB3_10900 [Halalkalicoccus jeotgali B3]ELY36029.1 hypothetical protein C497_11772 [Halalkalicoccus jeotgali B3]